ncbi:hypothetical protein L0Y97_20535 [Burkholderia multivorans]|uniref:hypothetical protein n=1 Tax=Burkholderia multivorans TaxID=87883 RepID=UPI0020189215|nr:hypothetical protein [Burkholderia multivorans]MCO1361316.1 hypothetical protein [Burkholderia multivorans]MCO1421086.1 hypothetical protein [Burkholderia multivorans]UQO93636.1 hypothetical protein L0Z41_10490 [Burkholderia multivorans]
MAGNFARQEMVFATVHMGRAKEGRHRSHAPYKIKRGGEMRKLFLAVSTTFLALSAYATTDGECIVFGDKFAEYARDRDAGMSMETAARKARAKDGENGKIFVAGVYLNSEMVSMTPNEIRAIAVRSCLDR